MFCHKEAEASKSVSMIWRKDYDEKKRKNNTASKQTGRKGSENVDVEKEEMSG